MLHYPSSPVGEHHAQLGSFELGIFGWIESASESDQSQSQSYLKPVVKVGGVGKGSVGC